MLPSTPAQNEDPEDPPNDRFRGAFEHALLPAWICDVEQRYTEVNDALCQMLGQPRELLVGRHFSEFNHPDERATDAEQAQAMLCGGRDNYTREKRLIGANNKVIWALVAVRLVRDGQGAPLYFVAQANDLTDYHLREQRLRHLADHDPLTGLLNRRGFGRELRRHVSRLARYGAKGALLMLDLDNFKGYNDAHGHVGGDELLRAVGSGLGARLRAGDVIGRIGGDEFAVLLPEVTSEQAEVVAAALVQSVREIEQYGDAAVTASVGIFCFDDMDRLSEDGAMVGADLAMYAAKHGGRDRHAPFSARTALQTDPVLLEPVASPTDPASTKVSKY
ncbi:MAG TPA: diguanylate cyclase [Solirubrobacteraceae bacterium]|jgi:diguanylate cyclase (GGDEF)-like protein/PAS domain S-box-containing protein|nr:diguanylate cyclase [Solirubrobacteraceae bacterium]